MGNRARNAITRGSSSISESLDGSTLSSALQGLLAELDVVERRLIKSGPGHFAKARFIAVDHLFRAILAKSSELKPERIEVVVSGLLTTLADRIDEVLKNFDDLDPVSSRTAVRTVVRAETLADEFSQRFSLRRVIDLFSVPARFGRFPLRRTLLERVI
jgi:hypothetical protein